MQPTTQLEAPPTQQQCCVYVLADNISNCCASVLLNYLQASCCRVRRRHGRLASPTGAPSVSSVAPPPDWTSPCVAFQTEFGSGSGSVPANTNCTRFNHGQRVSHMDDVTSNMLASSRCFWLSVNLRMCYFLLERGSVGFSEVRL